MSLYAGDTSPKSIQFPIDTGDKDGRDISSVTITVRRPDGTGAEWTPSVSNKALTSALATYTLEADGSSLPLAGDYVVRIWAYASDDSLLFDTDEFNFNVKHPLAARPA